MYTTNPSRRATFGPLSRIPRETSQRLRSARKLVIFFVTPTSLRELLLRCVNARRRHEIPRRARNDSSCLLWGLSGRLRQFRPSSLISFPSSHSFVMEEGEGEGARQPRRSVGFGAAEDQMDQWPIFGPAQQVDVVARCQDGRTARRDQLVPPDQENYRRVFRKG
jgi:hypothetical protein